MFVRGFDIKVSSNLPSRSIILTSRKGISL